MMLSIEGEAILDALVTIELMVVSLYYSRLIANALTCAFLVFTSRDSSQIDWRLGGFLFQISPPRNNPCSTRKLCAPASTNNSFRPLCSYRQFF